MGCSRLEARGVNWFGNSGSVGLPFETQYKIRSRSLDFTSSPWLLLAAVPLPLQPEARPSLAPPAAAP